MATKSKPTPAEVNAKQEAEWKAENDLRTLIDAEKIKKEPSRLRAAMAKAKEQRAALETVTKKEA